MIRLVKLIEDITVTNATQNLPTMIKNVNIQTAKEKYK